MQVIIFFSNFKNLGIMKQILLSAISFLFLVGACSKTTTVTPTSAKETI